MQDKYNESVEVLLKTLAQIKMLIEDNNQNVKDCLSIMRDINKAIVPKRKNRFVSWFSALFGGKR